ncbi:MAG: hypothetical protein LC796_12070 [Acidobacteria bacterium]|nr:hypothetical protein [Acidobacteriota bacterium]
MRTKALASCFAAFLAGLATSGCSVTVAPVVAPDPQVACPGGVTAWRLEIADQRAERSDSPKVVETIRQSLVRSLPGCHWVSQAGAPLIGIELHRFSVKQDGNWEAAIEWSVVARDAGGRTLTEFQAESLISRPNYRGVDNEKAALQEALDQVMRRTLTGLRSVPSAR